MLVEEIFVVKLVKFVIFLLKVGGIIKVDLLVWGIMVCLLLEFRLLVKVFGF